MGSEGEAIGQPQVSSCESVGADGDLGKAYTEELLRRRGSGREEEKHEGGKEDKLLNRHG